MRFASILVATTLLAPQAFAQTVGSCARGMSIDGNTPWVLFDLGSAALRPEAKPVIAEAAARPRPSRRSASAWSARPTNWATRP